MNALSSLFATVRLGGWVIYPLTVLAIAALAIIFEKAYALARLARIPHEINTLAEGQIGDLEAVRLTLRELPHRHVLRTFTGPILNGDAAPIWRIESRAEAAAQHVEREMNRGLWLLETIVTAAPLLGLLGTIVGMMQAFNLIGAQGLVNPTGVTGGVAQALIATAVGLLIALVALFAFNYFSRRIGHVLDQLERVGTNLVDQIRLDREATQGGLQ